MALAVFMDESGQGLVEYSLIIGLVAAAAVGALGLFGSNLKTGLYAQIQAAFASII